MPSDVATLLAAAHFAATRHRLQHRKDDVSPYVNHPVEVAQLVAAVGGVSDVEVLAAALLHDTVEDTGTRPDELAAAFGARVRDVVLELSDDKDLPKQTRKQLMVEHAPSLSPGAKVVKLADLSSNVGALVSAPPEGWSLERKREYVDWVERVAAGLRGANPALEAHLAGLVADVRRKLAAAP
jgi:guanosine-3',5'-bis(diphosphate) 3'-pyrophosphohydrolase